MTKLKFKETGAETDGRSHRRKDKRKRDKGDRAHGPSKRHHAYAEGDSPGRKWASSDEDETHLGDAPASSKRSHGHEPSSSTGSGYFRHHAEKPDYDTLRAEMEEREFREKMFDALGDDERMDGLEARLNDFAQVPDRWRSAAMGGGAATELYDEDEFLKLDPMSLDDEGYAEWVRLGMYRKTHAAEHAERLRRKAAAAERRAEEKARRRETRRLEKIAEEERRQRREERRSVQMERARQEYQARWQSLLTEANDPTCVRTLAFADIPWPIFKITGSKAVLVADDFTEEAITTFLLPASGNGDRRERLRESFLRFHPDKFEGRFMRRVAEDDAEKVREAIGRVSRTLNSLLERK